MNTANQTNTGSANTEVTSTTTKRRGRPIDPNLMKRIYLTRGGTEGNYTYTVRGKGAPKPGSEAFFVTVQRNVPSVGFVFNSDTMKVESEVVPARVYKPKATTETVVVETQPAVVEAPTTHESAGGTLVTQVGEDTVVEAAAVAA